MSTVALITHNLRSTHNVGSLLRTAEGLGVDMVYFTGYTPYPLSPDDTRLPHLSAKLTRQIHKTALGAELTQPWAHFEDIEQLVSKLKKDGFKVCALEQTKSAVPLPNFVPADKTAVIVGNEPDGIDSQTLLLCDTHLVIPMKGQKESFNVAQAAAMCLYHITVKEVASSK